MTTQICTVCPGFSTQSEFEWSLHQNEKRHQLGIDNFNRGVAFAESKQAAEIEQLKGEIVNLKIIIANSDKYIAGLESDLRFGTEIVTKAVPE